MRKRSDHQYDNYRNGSNRNNHQPVQSIFYGIIVPVTGAIIAAIIGGLPLGTNEQPLGCNYNIVAETGIYNCNGTVNINSQPTLDIVKTDEVATLVADASIEPATLPPSATNTFTPISTKAATNTVIPAVPTSVPTLTPTIVPQTPPDYFEDFSDGQFQGWVRTFGGIFEIVEDETGNAIWQAADAGEMVLTTGNDWRNYSFSIDFRLTRMTNGFDEEADIIAFKFRRDASLEECYQHAYEILYDNSIIRAGVSCSHPLGDGGLLPIVENKWHTLQVRATGNEILWQIDDNPLIQINNDERSSGTFGIFARSGGLGDIQFDNLRIWLDD